MHILHELKKSFLEFTDVDVTAYVAGFYFDGFLTSATVMSFVLYEIASNPAIQSKLRTEVSKSFDEDKVLYEKLQNISLIISNKVFIKKNCCFQNI